MAIDLYFYTTNEKEKTQSLLDSIKAEHQDLFANQFLIYTADEATRIEKEIAAEHGLTAHSSFMVSLNDKSAAASVLTVANIVKGAFEQGQIIAMRGGSDDLI